MTVAPEEARFLDRVGVRGPGGLHGRPGRRVAVRRVPDDDMLRGALSPVTLTKHNTAGKGGCRGALSGGTSRLLPAQRSAAARRLRQSSGTHYCGLRDCGQRCWRPCYYRTARPARLARPASSDQCRRPEPLPLGGVYRRVEGRARTPQQQAGLGAGRSASARQQPLAAPRGMRASSVVGGEHWTRSEVALLVRLTPVQSN